MRGGCRPGAGRPKGKKNNKPKPLNNLNDIEPFAENLEAGDFLRQVWNHPKIDMALRLRAAEIVYKQSNEQKGKKEEKNDKARQAGHGRFAAGAPPAKVLPFKKSTDEL